MVARDERGRFLKGHSGNPSGRPIDQFKYQKKIDATITLEEWRSIIVKAIEQAKRGDAKARQWLSEYLAGKPAQMLEYVGDQKIIVEYVNQIGTTITAPESDTDNSG